MSDMAPEHEQKPNETTPPPVQETTPPPAPTPEPPKETHEGPTRDEFNILTQTVTALAEAVNKLIPQERDASPVKRPWTHWGSRDKA